MVGYDTKNKDTLDPRYLCPACLLVLHEPLQLSTCGHRQCQSCIDIQKNDTINCPKCGVQATKRQLMIDRGFKTEMQSLPIECILCSWSGQLRDYQQHFTLLHPHPICPHCNQSFQSLQHFNQHHLQQCPQRHQLSIDCLLKPFGCHQQIARDEKQQHYLSEQHQQAAVTLVRQIIAQRQQQSDASISCLPQDIEDMLDVLTDTIETLMKDEERLSRDSLHMQLRLQTLVEYAPQLKLSVQESQSHLDAIKINFAVLNQELRSLNDKVSNSQYVSYDGTLIWKITGFQEKMNDARLERQTSLYSPAFYSSLAGYKMRLRLYLNGDGNARQTHLSLFFVLMRGANDAVLKFPFTYKVTFCLFDQSGRGRHVIDSFRPDVRSNSFQRPRSEMNIASGIPKFLPLSALEGENNGYVVDDTVFIKVLVDFGEMREELLPYAMSLNPGVPTYIQQIMIRQEAEQRVQEGSTV
ncbi:unnamed protein product [Adineta ricciae]|uniref:Uncharacterized protein n=2 Tax=Adineta ricciae TaxID=249248 RepID=A0A813QRZ1_ADIRI|nr:unnamed protein product [Adineta ricciae]